MPERCPICQEVRGSGAGAERRLWTDDECAVLVSVGALAEGHLLVCPVEHARSWAGRPVGELQRSLHVAGRVASAVEGRLGVPVQMFEHGNALSGTRVACTVEHAHLHLVPADQDIEPALAAVPGARWETVAWSADEICELTAGREYLLHRDHHGAAKIWITDEQPIASQLMRRMLAMELGRPESWNWREAPADDLVCRTRETFADLPVLLSGAAIA